MAGFYQVYVRRRRAIMTASPSAAVEAALSDARDWYRITPELYVICTDMTASEWSALLQPSIRPHGHLLVWKLDGTDRQGWMPKALWDWIKECRMMWPDVAGERPSKGEGAGS